MDRGSAAGKTTIGLSRGLSRRWACLQTHCAVISILSPKGPGCSENVMIEKGIKKVKRWTSVQMPGRARSLAGAAVLSLCLCIHVTYAQVLGDLVDTSSDFQKLEQVYFVGNRVVSFDPRTGSGTLE